MLGLAVAVAAMIALLGISHNFEHTVVSTFERRGLDLVVVKGAVTEQLNSELPDTVIAQIKAIPGVVLVDAALIEMTDISRAPRNPDDNPPVFGAMVQGWPAENFERSDQEILAGRNLTPADLGHRRALLGNTMAENLRAGVGDTIVIHREKVEVVGVYKSFNVFETGSVLMLLKDYQEVSQRGPIITGLSLRVDKSGPDPDAAVEAVRKAITQLKGLDGRLLGLSARTPRDYAQNAAHLKLSRGMAWVVSVIAIVIAVISMLNTMIMSVMERTHEIGILRAVGWPRSRVVRMVLGEAVFLALASAAVGAVAAIGATHLLSMAPRVNGFIEGGVPLMVIAQGVGLAVLIGIVGGAYPAYRAARLLPTEAIRHE